MLKRSADENRATSYGILSLGESRVRDWHPDGCMRASRQSEFWDSSSLGAVKGGRTLHVASKQSGYC